MMALDLNMHSIFATQTQSYASRTYNVPLSHVLHCSVVLKRPLNPVTEYSCSLYVTKRALSPL